MHAHIGEPGCLGTRYGYQEHLVCRVCRGGASGTETPNIRQIGHENGRSGDTAGCVCWCVRGGRSSPSGCAANRYARVMGWRLPRSPRPLAGQARCAFGDSAEFQPIPLPSGALLSRLFEHGHSPQAITRTYERAPFGRTFTAAVHVSGGQSLGDGARFDYFPRSTSARPHVSVRAS